MVISAQQHLQKLIHDIRNQTPRTLAVWRLSNVRLIEVLEAFAAGGAPNTWEELLRETQDLFDRVNSILAKQEEDSTIFIRERRRPYSKKDSDASLSNQISVVFGGKYAPGTPQSISERLVSKLSEKCPQVWTVSRSQLSYAIPNNIKHVSKQGLDDKDIGKQEFSQVMTDVISDWKSLQAQNDANSAMKLVFYFTLGQHKGENPFARNLTAAENFAEALQSKLSRPRVSTGSTPTNAKWRVVMTGTDATLPTSYADASISLPTNYTQHEGETIEEITIPSYKIMKYNYTYAMSKLGQYYIIANAIAKLVVPDKETAGWIRNMETVIARIKSHVHAAGEDGNYHEKCEETTVEQQTSHITMVELDRISRGVDEIIVPKLKPHLAIAEGISICYTPLHARPWTEQAMKQKELDPKAYVLEQIVKRFKNAVSIEHAVISHLSNEDLFGDKEKMVFGDVQKGWEVA